MLSVDEISMLEAPAVCYKQRRLGLLPSLHNCVKDLFEG